VSAARENGLAAVRPPLLRAWEEAYQHYRAACEALDAARHINGPIAWRMADASTAVASTWREIASQGVLSWWIVAAVASAAEAFEEQAARWRYLAQRLGTGTGAGFPGPARPRAFHSTHHGGR
jgi:hypothetical protein